MATEIRLKASAMIGLLGLMVFVLGASASDLTGFPSRRMIEAPSISTQVLPSSNVRQWIFPSMVFNCTGNVTRWIFKAEETGNNNERVPRMSTWRSNRFTLTTTDFNRISQSGSAEELTGNGPVYEYVLQEPVEVQEGDILGFDLSPEDDEELQFVFLDLGAGNAPNSYFRNFLANNINIAPSRVAAGLVTRNQQYLPLITAVIGSPDGSSTSVILPTSTPPPTPTQGSQATPSQTGTPTLPASNRLPPPSTSSSSSPPSPSSSSFLSPSPTPTDTTTPHGSGTDVGVIVGALMGVLLVLAILITVILLILLLLWRKQYRTKQPPIDNPTYQDVISGRVSKTQTGKSTSSNGSYHIYAMPSQVGGTTVTLSNTSSQEHYEFDDNLPHVFQTPYELESASSHYTEPRVQSATLPSQYEIPVSALSTLQSSQTSQEETPGGHIYSVLEGDGIYVPTEEERKSLTDTSSSLVFDDTIYSRMSKKYQNLLHSGEFFEREEAYWRPASSKTALYDQLARKRYREIVRHQIQIVEHLGAGQFGTVNKGLWQLSTGTMEVAVKTLKPNITEEDKIKFLQEAAIMGQFLHPNVVKLHGVVTVGEPTMIVLEYMPKGDLRNYLLSRQPQPGEMVPSNLPLLLLKFCREIASGMNYLSNKSFVHRDLAARNILVNAENTCKIGDFGMSRDLADNNYYITHGGKIPVKWTAPEALHYRKYSTASDVWSYGALMYEIWSLGHKPFEGYTNHQSMQLIESGCRLAPPPGCHRALYRLMIHCWHSEAGKRPTFSAIVKMLSHSDSHLLSWTDQDKKVHPQASCLGAPLEAGENLYPDLQEYYMDDKQSS